MTYSTSPNGHSFTDWIANGNGIYIRSCRSCGYEQTKAMETESSDSQSVTPSTADNGVVSIAIITLLTLCAALYVKKLR